MALIICPECGKKVSDHAKSCPHCGFPLEETDYKAVKGRVSESTPFSPKIVKKMMKQSQNKRWIIFGISFFVLISIVLFFLFNSLASTRQKTERNRISSAAQEDYQAGKFEEAIKKWESIGDQNSVNNVKTLLDLQGDWESKINIGGNDYIVKLSINGTSFLRMLDGKTTQGTLSVRGNLLSLRHTVGNEESYIIQKNGNSYCLKENQTGNLYNRS